MALTSWALAAAQSPSDRWYVSCYGARCSMSHIFLGADATAFEMTLGLHFARSTGKLTAVAAKAPADADRDRGVEIGFLDGPAPQKNTVPFTVPLASCDDDGCMGSVENGRDLQADFVDNALKYQVLTVSYYAKGQRKTLMEESGRFRAEYPNLLAEMKKPQ